MASSQDAATRRSSKKAKGYYNARRKVFRVAKQAVIKAGQYAYVGPPPEEARLSRAVDPAHQCGRPRIRSVVQPLHLRPAEGGHRDRPQGAGGSGGARHRRVRRHCRESESRTGREDSAGSSGGRGEGPGVAGRAATPRRTSARARSCAALDAVRVAVLGKKGETHGAAEGLGKRCRREERRARGRRDQRGQAAHRGRARCPRARELERGRRCHASSRPARSTSRCPVAGRPSAACIP